jgi:hypothetical protein
MNEAMGDHNEFDLPGSSMLDLHLANIVRGVDGVGGY